jgi:hypothetical protein
MQLHYTNETESRDDHRASQPMPEASRGGKPTVRTPEQRAAIDKALKEIEAFFAKGKK